MQPKKKNLYSEGARKRSETKQVATVFARPNTPDLQMFFFSLSLFAGLPHPPSTHKTLRPGRQESSERRMDGGRRGDETTTRPARDRGFLSSGGCWEGTRKKKGRCEVDRPDAMAPKTLHLGGREGRAGSLEDARGEPSVPDTQRGTCMTRPN